MEKKCSKPPTVNKHEIPELSWRKILKQILAETGLWSLRPPFCDGQVRQNGRRRSPVLQDVLMFK